MRTRTSQRLIAELAAEIEAGRRWRPGDRLPPQRTLARTRGIAASTVSLVYRELTRRGLVAGETGRGTYVRAPAAPVSVALLEPANDAVDLALNVPLAPEQARLLADSLTPLLRRSTAFEAALRPVEAVGTSAARRIAATFLSRAGWKIDPDHLIFAGNGKQALGAVIAALVRPGQRLATDALTYPAIKAIAARLSIQLVSIAMDDEGLRPDALGIAHLRAPIAAAYVQPAIHNPIGVTMSDRRRAELARVLRRHNLIAIEDAVYGFLAPDVRPLAAFAPEHVIVVDSLSKRVAPGLTIGTTIAPATLRAPIAAAVRMQACGPTGVALIACTQWMTDGTAARIAAAKRGDAAARQRMLRQIFADVHGVTVTSDARAYHAWLTLPTGLRAADFVAAAAREGIAVVPGSAFAVSPGHAPNAVRLALASPTPDTLSSALRTLAAIASARIHGTHVRKST